MSKGTILATIMSTLFPKSGTNLSEKLSTEEYNEVVADAEALHGQIEANTTLTADLATANATIATLTADLATANGKLETANASVTSLTKERDAFKAHHDKAKEAGLIKGEDSNADEEPKTSSYNAHAMAVWAKKNKS